VTEPLPTDTAPAMAAAELPAIEVRDMSKVYRVYNGHGRGWLQSVLLPFVSPDRFSTTFAALRGIDMTLDHGEVVGVMGRNGSGKSTLLKVLAGMTAPTSGDVTVRGTMRCMMASGVGFNPRLSGRANIIFGSVAMGIARSTAVERMDAIIEFAELEDHIDKPVMYYSKGMRSRLALGVTLQEVPDILILDEALSAGDAGFTEKCRQRIDETCASGSTILIATHSLGFIRRTCTRAILLHDGQLVADGAPDEIVQEYDAVLGVRSRPMSATARPVVGDGAITLQDAYLCGDVGARRTHFVHGERLELHLVLETSEPVEHPRITVELVSADEGVRVTQIGAHYLDARTGAPSGLRPERLDGRYVLAIVWPRNPLGTGDFFWRVSVSPWLADPDGEPRSHLRESGVCPFRSESFPGRSWQRRTILEPESEVRLVPAPAPESLLSPAAAAGEP
jgi:ABC-type polysaccharide/polyol phosphate transport system ATPase subunit